jgi:hypothetical protein
MPSAAGFVFNKAPGVEDYPQTNFDWLGNLGAVYQQSRQQNLQNQMMNLQLAGAQRGFQEAFGTPPPGQQQPGSYSPQASFSQQPSAQPASNVSDPRGKIPVIMAAAQKYGVDPRTAVRVAQSEGLTQFASGIKGEDSWGAFQLNTQGGMGNDFQRDTGLDPRDPKNEDAAIDYAIKKAAQGGWGPFHGAKRVGIGQYDGLPGRGETTTREARASQAERDVQTELGGNRNGSTSSPAPVEQPPGAVGNAPFMASSSQNGAGPANVGGEAPTRVSMDERSANQGGPTGPENRGSVPQGPAPTRSPIEGPETEPYVQAIDKRLSELNKKLTGLGAMGTMGEGMGKGVQTEITQKLKQREDYIARRSEAMKQQQLTTEEDIRTKQKSTTDRYDKIYDETQRKGEEAENTVQTLNLAKAFMDDPDFNSGATAKYDLQLKRVISSLGGDPNAALPMEGFKKAVGTAILEQIRSLGGQGLGQVRNSEISTMKEAAQNTENTPAANRLLTEMGMRLASRWTLPIKQLAQDYSEAHGGHLDQGFDKMKSAWIEKHPLFTPEELKDVRRIAPPLARTPDDLARIGWSDGMPFRTPSGEIKTHGPVTVTVKRPTPNAATAAPIDYNPRTNSNAL